MSGIRIAGVSKAWGCNLVLRDVSFSAPAGSLTVLLGSSGSGKSTLLRLIAGLDSVTSGRIFIGDRDVTAELPSRRGIAMVFQNYALFPHLSVAENILFGLRVRKIGRAECDEKLTRVASLLGLSGLLERKPAQLSGGQQQRVALGRAIIAEHPICLMDEPMSNLDALLRAEMRMEIQALQRKLGITMVHVTHDQVEAMSMADQVVLLNGGRVEQVAAPAEMYAAPATVFAARFIGTPPMNLIALGRLPGGGLVIAGTREPVAIGQACQDKACQGQASGGELLLGLRPEEIRVSPEGAAASVVSAEYIGSDTIVGCRIGDQKIQVRVPRLVRLAPGDEVRLSWSPDAVHLFDREAGRLAVPPSPEPMNCGASS